MTERSSSSEKKVHVTPANWSLILGGLVVLIIVLLAIFGPTIAPKDPLERFRVLHTGEGWEIPPYSPFTPGFPLGSDEVGRDIYSRLLWAVRPTLILVIVVAAVRLLLGILIGFAAGWMEGWPSRLLDLSISASLAIPAIIVALAAVSNISISLRSGFGERMWAFIIGLSITGWAETAQQVRAQTRLTKGQDFIESARAMGASTAHILRQHILRHVSPLVWVLFAFEVSNTLLLTGGLGFLGRFIGGIQKLPGEAAATGYPELGEMLASTRDIIVEPWVMVAAASFIFLAILGFNLLGQGLYHRLRQQNLGRRTLFTRAAHWGGLWIEENLTYPLSRFLGRARRPLQAALLIIVILGVSYSWSRYREQVGEQLSEAQTVLETMVLPGEATPTPLPTAITTTANILWTFDPEVGMVIAPIISPQGWVYLFSNDNVLHVLDTDGGLQWETTLDKPPHRTTDYYGRNSIAVPAVAVDGTVLIMSQKTAYALGDQGELLWEAPLEAPPATKMCCQWSGDGSVLYVLDEDANLYAFAPQTGLEWMYQPPETGFRPESAPVVGPNGNIYYSVGQFEPNNYYLDSETNFLQTVTPQGVRLWITTIPYYNIETLSRFDLDLGWLQVSPDGSLIFLSDYVYRASDGTQIAIPLDEFFTPEDQYSYPIVSRFFAGLNGRIYVASSAAHLLQWQLGSAGFEVIQSSPYDEGNSFRNLPIQAGAALDHTVWLLSPGIFRSESSPNPAENTFNINWYDLENGLTRFAQTEKGDRIVAIDEQTATFYICRAPREQSLTECNSILPWTKDPDWQITVEGVTSIRHAALDLEAGRLYIFANNNNFYVIDVGILGENP